MDQGYDHNLGRRGEEGEVAICVFPDVLGQTVAPAEDENVARMAWRACDGQRRRYAADVDVVWQSLKARKIGGRGRV